MYKYYQHYERKYINSSLTKNTYKMYFPGCGKTGLNGNGLQTRICKLRPSVIAGFAQERSLD